MKDELLRRIQGEFLEMPGLRLTRQQAQRLWGLDQPTCSAVLEILVADNFLLCAADGRYTRLAEGGPAAAPLRMARVDAAEYGISPARRGNLPPARTA